MLTLAFILGVIVVYESWRITNMDYSEYEDWLTLLFSYHIRVGVTNYIVILLVIDGVRQVRSLEPRECLRSA